MKEAPRSRSDLRPSAFAEAGCRFKANGVIDLTRINPEMPPSRLALAAVRQFVGTGDGARYADVVSRPSLCDAIAAHYQEEYSVTLDPESQICVVPGTRFAIMALAVATAEPGDEILIPDPGYPDYAAAARAAGAAITCLPLDRSVNFQPDWGACYPLSRPALLFLNYPSNPCGACANEETFADALAFARRHKCWVAHDLAYGAFCYDGRPTMSMLQQPGATDVAVEMWSASKSFGLAGWRIGAVVGNSDLVQRVSALVELNVAAVWHGFQVGLTAALEGGSHEVQERVSAHQDRRDVLVAALVAAEAVVARPEGGMSIWCRAPQGLDAEGLLRDYGVAAMAGEVFGSSGAGWLRLALSVPVKDLDEAATRLRDAFAAA